MREGWYYADGETPVGPLTLDALVLHLRAVAEPGEVKVWHAELPDWQAASAVPQLSERIGPSRSDGRIAATAGAAGRSRGGGIALLMALAIFLAVGAIVFTLVYGRSANGFTYVVGQLAGAAVIVWLLTWRWRSPYRPAVILLVAGLCVAAGHSRALLDSVAVSDGMAALRGVRDPAGVEKALEQNPSNVVLQLAAAATREAQDTERLGQKLWDEIDAAFALDVNYASASRAELEAHHREIKAAETNAATALPRFVALFAEERQKVESHARSLQIDESTTREFLEGVDNRHARVMALIAKMLPARADAYRGAGDLLAVVIDQFGSYKAAPNGQLTFARQADADRFNTAVAEIDAAARRMEELDLEAKQLRQSQQDGWERAVSGR